LPSSSSSDRLVAEFLSRLSGCNTESELWPIQIRVEERFTPHELLRVIAEAPRLPPPVQRWLSQISALLAPNAAMLPDRYERHALAEDIALYSDTSVPAARKILLVCFCGYANRLMLPMPVFLSHISSASCDVLVLRDRHRRHYAAGVPGHSNSLLDLCQRLERELAPQAYQRLCCFGTSAGALPALQAGIFMRAERGIAAGGRFPAHPLRLLDPGTALPAFDPLCACNRESRTLLISAYGQACEEDRLNAARLAAVLPVRDLAYPGISSHNLLLALVSSGRIAGFFARVLG